MTICLNVTMLCFWLLLPDFNARFHLQCLNVYALRHGRCAKIVLNKVCIFIMWMNWKADCLALIYKILPTFLDNGR